LRNRLNVWDSHNDRRVRKLADWTLCRIVRMMALGAIGRVHYRQ
jgi:hypothetical protein